MNDQHQIDTSPAANSAEVRLWSWWWLSSSAPWVQRDDGKTRIVQLPLQQDRRPVLAVLLDCVVCLHCPATSHGQNDAELCVAAQHARVSLGCFFERICLDHGTHAGQFGEVQCVFGIGGGSRSPALNPSTSAYEL